MIPNGNSSFLDEDSSEKLLFGDLIIVCYDENKKFMDFDTLDYAQVYEILFEGFDDCDSEDDLEEEEKKNLILKMKTLLFSIREHQKWNEAGM